MIGQRGTIRRSLDRIQDVTCKLCDRHEMTSDKSKVCLGGHGNVRAPIVAIGSYNPMPDDQQRIFDAVLAELEMTDLVYQTAIVRCSADILKEPINRAAARACSMNYLPQEVSLVNPKMILLMGPSSIRWLWQILCREKVRDFDYMQPIFCMDARKRGWQFGFMDRKVLFPVIHPAAVIQVPESLTVLIQQLRAAKEFYFANLYQPTYGR